MDRRALPAVETLARELRASGAGHAVAVGAAREALGAVRAEIEQGTGPDDPAADARARAAAALAARAAHRPVLNATGILLHTNLGRAPLAQAAVTAAAAALTGYSDLELDLTTGQRGRRQRALAQVLCDLTGAADAHVVNNNAGAVLLAVAAVGRGGDVLVSRGEAVEIGGGFRVPDVVAKAGSGVVEVGTTNRTRAADFARAITPRTSALLHVHPSNFTTHGFTEAPAIAELAALARRAGIALIVDAGSGLLDTTAPWLPGPVPAWLEGEPAARQSLDAGATVVTFSGDKLLGGPQAGIAVGEADAVAAMAAHPLARALRTDKASLAALHATLDLYVSGEAAVQIPFWRAATRAPAALEARLTSLEVPGLQIEAGASMPGGGSVPGRGIEGPVGVIPCADAEAVAARLRTGEPAVIARVAGGAVRIDLRAIEPEDDVAFGAAVRAALG